MGSEVAERVCLRPTQLTQTDSVVPDLGHVANAITVELHHVDVVRLDALSGGRHRSAFARIRAAKDTKSRVRRRVWPGSARGPGQAKRGVEHHDAFSLADGRAQRAETTAGRLICDPGGRWLLWHLPQPVWKHTYMIQWTWKRGAHDGPG